MKTTEVRQRILEKRLTWHNCDFEDKFTRVGAHQPECSKSTSMHVIEDAKRFAKQFNTTVYVGWGTPKQFLVTSQGEIQQ